jgi:GxxExxY protein
MHEPSDELDRLARTVLAAAIEVHCGLGPGLLESIYEEALGLELGLREVAFARQVSLVVQYKGHVVGHARIDLLVDRRLVVELKAVDTLAPLHVAQVLSYLRMAHLPLALLINFNVPVLLRGVKRIVQSG